MNFGQLWHEKLSNYCFYEKAAKVVILNSKSQNKQFHIKAGSFWHISIYILC